MQHLGAAAGGPHSAWDQDGYRLSDYREFTLTERRKRIMQPPSIGDRPRTVPEDDTTPGPQPF